MARAICPTVGCDHLPERCHRFCIACELDGADERYASAEHPLRGRPQRVRHTKLAPTQPPVDRMAENAARRDNDRVVILTVREATAVQQALQEWSDATVLNADRSDLGRAFRLIGVQLNWITGKYPSEAA